MRSILRKEISFSRILSPNEDRFSLLWPLYERSFPKHERRSLFSQVQAMKDSRFHCMAIQLQWETVGLLWYWESPQFFYIEHMATLPSTRGRGIGAGVLETLKRKNRPIILETEPPENEINRRRIAFYKRCGFHLNDFRYMHRGYAKRAEPHPLLLMTSRAPCSANTVENFNAFVKERVLAYIDV